MMYNMHERIGRIRHINLQQEWVKESNAHGIPVSSRCFCKKEENTVSQAPNDDETSQLINSVHFLSNKLVNMRQVSESLVANFVYKWWQTVRSFTAYIAAVQKLNHVLNFGVLLWMIVIDYSWKKLLESIIDFVYSPDQIIGRGDCPQGAVLSLHADPFHLYQIMYFLLSVFP